MITRIILKIIFIIFFYSQSYTDVIYQKNNLIITEIDIEIYQHLYKENYNQDINKSNSLKDLVLIKNLINSLEETNLEFINKIDSEILLQYGEITLVNKNVKDFYRFSRIRDEFIINYFNNTLQVEEVKSIFKRLDNI